MDDFLRSLPKAELHVHLEGSIEVATLLELAPALSREEAEARYQYDDFLGFLDSYKWVNHFLQTPRDYALVARRLFERLHREGVVHAEVNLSAGVILWRNQSVEAMFEAVAEEAARAPFPVLFLFDAVRQFGLEAAWAVARAAVALRDRGVVGYGIGGDEARGPATLFREVFSYARGNGLHLVPHAGEYTSARSIWEALEVGAERIGHGIRAIEDPALLRHLRERGIPLEICISSNVRTGAVASLEAHPVRQLWEAGVPIVLNSDDPPMFQTTLLGEYRLAAEKFGFREDELRTLAANSLRYRFMA
jgi:aminodeoxyfutalosine deaminase